MLDRERMRAVAAKQEEALAAAQAQEKPQVKTTNTATLNTETFAEHLRFVNGD